MVKFSLVAAALAKCRVTQIIAEIANQTYARRKALHEMHDNVANVDLALDRLNKHAKISSQKLKVPFSQKMKIKKGLMFADNDRH